MAKPIANFNITTEGLSVRFTDSSSGIPTSWNWDFGDTHIAVGQGPHDHTYTDPGIYQVKLAVANSEGSDVFAFNLLVNSTPTLNLTIAEMVQCNIPIGLAVDTLCFRNNMQKWQLYLQPLLNPTIPDNHVFKEEFWPPLANVLISKLIIYEMVLAAAASSMASYFKAMQSFNNSLSTSPNTLQVADYTLEFPGDTYTTFVVEQVGVNGLTQGPSPALSDLAQLLSWLNGLNIGLFSFEGNTLQSLANNNIITSFNITFNLSGVTTGYNLTFTQGNVRVVTVDQTIITQGASDGLGMGPVKAIETGPSKTQWYDASSFWGQMFKGASSGAVGPNAGGAGSIWENIVADLCAYASRLGIRLPMCPALPSKGVPMFKTSRNPHKNFCFGRISHIPSKG